jgi:hypothetical protein
LVIKKRCSGGQIVNYTKCWLNQILNVDTGKQKQQRNNRKGRCIYVIREEGEEGKARNIKPTK